MESDALASAAPVGESGSGRSAVPTLLRVGMVVGPFYLAVGLVQAFVRDGFDLARHPLSLLANGPGGWVQTANFVLSGLMVLAAAVGIARALRPQSRATSWFLGFFGASMILAAVFRADPVDGFPIGTPEGFPTTVSTSGLLHFIAGGLGFMALAVACFVAGLAMSRRKEKSIARLSFLSGVAIILGFFSPMILPGVPVGTAGIWFSVVVGWTWLALLSVHLYRTMSDADGLPAHAARGP